MIENKNTLAAAAMATIFASEINEKIECTIAVYSRPVGSQPFSALGTHIW